MKTAHKVVFKPAPREAKGETVRFRVDLMRKKHWVDALEEIGVSDFSSYARQAIDGAIDQDLRAKDPKWQEFLKRVAPIAREVLGFELSDRPEDRNENLSEIERILFKRGQELARERGITHQNTKPLPSPDKKIIRFMGRKASR